MTSLAFEEDERPPKIETLAIDELKLDPEIQARPIDPRIVAEYAEQMAAGDVFPPVKVTSDGTVNYLTGGWQRVAAACQIGQASIRCKICEGDRRAALLASTATNARHGVRRSPEDKRRAVLKLLNDPEWSRWSDREIARQCRVSHTFVAEVRASLVTGNVASELPIQRVVQLTSRHGTPAQMTVPIIRNAAPKTTTMLDSALQAETLASVFGEPQMAHFERLAQRVIRHADKTFAARIKKAGRQLVKTGDRLETAKKKA
jgi:hypothetical protein